MYFLHLSQIANYYSSIDEVSIFFNLLLSYSILQLLLVHFIENIVEILLTDEYNDIISYSYSSYLYSCIITLKVQAVFFSKAR